MSIVWFCALLDTDRGEWDAADAAPVMRCRHYWRIEGKRLDELERIAREVWDKSPEENRVWLKVSGVINLRDIVAIDELGDLHDRGLLHHTHIYVLTPLELTKSPPPL
jgi:hypothetical protein